MFTSKIRFDYIIPSLLLLFAFTFFIIHNSGRKEVLVVHSYQTDYSWVRDVNSGLKNIFANEKRYNVRYHYMDTKRHTWPTYLRNAGLITRRLIGAIRPQVIICVDDDAQRLVGQYYINDPNISVIFSGVNASQETYGYDKAKNVTGILERLPLGGLRDTFYLLARQRGLAENVQIRTAHISDNSPTVQNDDKYMRQFSEWGRVKLEDSKLVGTFDEWKKAVLEANKTLDFITISNYRSIRRNPNDKEFMSPKEVLEWTMQNATIPAIGVNAFFVEEGGGLAIATSPYEQGSSAGLAAQQIVIGGKTAKDIPIVRTEQFIVCIRDSIVEKMNIELPDIYDAFARVTKKHYR
ncbi:MAG: hypothetical protein H6849_01705 [Alphaproteobacteria bacterium]|nr:MAG: hypothetical protein H6849_01705 [Alphaproteobacteria bacterium]